MDKKILLAILPPFWPKMPPSGLTHLESFILHKGIKIDLLDINNIFYNLSPPELKKEYLAGCDIRF